MLGKFILIQDNLRALVGWLHVSADELRFGILATPFRAQDSVGELPMLSMQDRDMLARYLNLPVEARKTVCDVVAALGVVASVKGRG